jgi:hypothetical protein
VTLQELEQQLLRLPPTDKLRLIQLLAQSLNALWRSHSQPATKLSEFFRQSLPEVAATVELDLSRDRTLPIDRFIL